MVIKVKDPQDQETALQYLINSLGDADPEVRNAVVNELYDILLTEQDSGVKEIILKILGEVLGDIDHPARNEAIVQLINVLPFGFDQDMDIETLENLIKTLNDNSPNIFENLIKFLNDEDVGIRQYAIEQIAEVFPFIQDEDTREFILEKLIKSMSDEDPRIRGRVINFLCEAFPTIENTAIQKSILQKLSDLLMDDELGSLALTKLGRILSAPRLGTKDTVLQDLRHQLANADFRIRKTAVQILGEVFPAIPQNQDNVLVRDLVLQELLQASHDDEPAVRIAAIYALSRVLSQTPKFSLIESHDKRSLLEAFKSGMSSNQKTAMEALENSSISDNPAAVQDAAVQALTRAINTIAPSARIIVLEHLGKRLLDSDVLVRRTAAKQLIRVFPAVPEYIQRIAVNELIDKLKNDNCPEEVYKVLVQIFPAIPPDSHKRTLLLILGDKLMENDSFALEALKKILVIRNNDNHETVLEEVIGMLNCNRLLTTESLLMNNLEDDAAVDRLMSIQESIDEVGVAIEILGKVFPAIPEAMQGIVLQALQEKLQVENPIVNRAAAQALNQAEGTRARYRYR